MSSATVFVTGQVLSRDSDAGTVRIWLLGLVDEQDEFTIPIPPDLPTWAAINYVWCARLDSDVRTIEELAARPSALHSFEPGGLDLWKPSAFPPADAQMVAITNRMEGPICHVALGKYDAGKWWKWSPKQEWMEIEEVLWWATLPPQ